MSQVHPLARVTLEMADSLARAGGLGQRHEKS